MLIDNALFDDLLEKAAGCERRRLNYDLRTSPGDSSQRMLNALLPDTVVPVHRHRTTSESVVVLKGRVTELFYEEVVSPTSRLPHEVASYDLGVGEMIQIPAGVWHTIVAHEPSVIFEAKDGAFLPLLPEDILPASPL